MYALFVVVCFSDAAAAGDKNETLNTTTDIGTSSLSDSVLANTSSLCPAHCGTIYDEDETTESSSASVAWSFFSRSSSSSSSSSSNNNGTAKASDSDSDCSGCPVDVPADLTDCQKDGVRNGDETGVDCGGALCDPCDNNDNNNSSSSSASPITEYFDRFAMPITRNNCTTLHKPHSQKPWSIFTAGRCSGCGIPSRISTAAFQDTLLVAWVGSAWYPSHVDRSRQYRYGHLSTFRFREDSNGFSKIGDVMLDGCRVDMGSVAVSPDGSVIGALCVTYHDVPVRGNVTILGDTSLHSTEGDNNNQNKPRLFVYLLEWTGGTITQTPQTVVLVTKAAGGWNYGHWDLSLSNDASVYFMELKLTTLGWHHEAEGHLVVDRTKGYRQYGWKDPHPQWPDRLDCGDGHAPSYRITHNRYHDSFAVYCGVSSRTIKWRTVPNQRYTSNVSVPELGIEPDRAASVVTLGQYTATGDIANRPGGLQTLMSLGRRGWLATALGPFDIWEGIDDAQERQQELVKQQIGVRRLPLTIAELAQNASEYPWNWVDLESVCAPTKGWDRRAGMVQIHNWGLGGEDSGRILLGYSPAMRHPGKANEYHVVEVDEQGTFLHDPVVLQRGGWGVDSLGTHMPGSGCVVFPFTWIPDDPEEGPGEQSYPQNREKDGRDESDPNDPGHYARRSEFLKLTAVCPNTAAESTLRRSPGVCQTQGSRLFVAPPWSPPHYEEMCIDYQG